jgi:SAM-dependent methyltransferase
MADPYGDDAARRYLREHAHHSVDLPFWRRAARALGSPVLDLGCGVGRVTLPLARDGAEVWALDSSPAMLAELERRLEVEPPEVAARVHPVAGRLQDFELTERFPMVLIAMSTLQVLLDPADQLACLRAVAEHLAPGGELLLDLVLPDPVDIAVGVGVVRMQGTHHDPRSGVTLVHTSVYESWDAIRQNLRFTLTVDERHPTGSLTRHIRQHEVHLFLPPEFAHLATLAGLEVIEAFGDFDASPMEAASQRQIYRCRAVA